ncbi:MAG: YbaB/EbfC family nucleoid-associated protein [Deltaproteobacteria bacterium]|nr:YbaB/EbfC family nucleoid-associated protein [Deltaproteobacteria bacterium]
MSKDLGNIMKQARKMQESMAEVQKALAIRTCEATSGGGMVTAVVNGNQELISLKIDPSVVDPKDVDMLQDLITAAVSEAFRRSKEMVSQEMGKITSGFGVDLPGMFK